MLASGYDFIGCPYPRKRVQFAELSKPGAHENPEWRAYEYSYHFDESVTQGKQEVPVVGGCVPVQRLSMGCMLTSMRALSAMYEMYRDDLWFTDVIDGKHYDCVAIFQLILTETVDLNGRPFRALLSEDYSFCDRYNKMREMWASWYAWPPVDANVEPYDPIQMLVAFPADHVGTHLFRGYAQGLAYGAR
jgi:hypothetical protein